jgi:hypothetical protein
LGGLGAAVQKAMLPLKLFQPELKLTELLA